jgi:hypothetical protein
VEKEIFASQNGLRVSVRTTTWPDFRVVVLIRNLAPYLLLLTVDPTKAIRRHGLAFIHAVFRKRRSSGYVTTFLVNLYAGRRRWQESMLGAQGSEMYS